MDDTDEMDENGFFILRSKINLCISGQIVFLLNNDMFSHIPRTEFFENPFNPCHPYAVLI